MGCDIHAVIERRKTYGEDYHRWQNAGEPDIGRDYEVFAALAGVRNSDGIEPISPPRGLPGVTGVHVDDSGFTGDCREQPCYEFEAYYLHGWRQDAHSASWVTLAEVKAYDAEQMVEDSSVITARDADSGRVLSTARGVWRGGRDVTAELERVGTRRIFSWPGHDEDAPTAWDRLIAAMERAKPDENTTDDEIRLVFFFDN